MLIHCTLAMFSTVATWPIRKHKKSRRLFLWRQARQGMWKNLVWCEYDLNTPSSPRNGNLGDGNGNRGPTLGSQNFPWSKTLCNFPVPKCRGMSFPESRYDYQPQLVQDFFHQQCDSFQVQAAQNFAAEATSRQEIRRISWTESGIKRR